MLVGIGLRAHRSRPRWRVVLGCALLVLLLLATSAGVLRARAAADTSGTPAQSVVHHGGAPAAAPPPHARPRAVHPHAVLPPGQPVTGLAGWDRFITDDQTGGLPWNANGAGGSGMNPGSFDEEYFSPSAVSVSNTGARIVATPGAAEPGYTYTSGVLASYGRESFAGGTIAVTAEMPDMTSGAWPSIWLLSGPGDGAAEEIDIFEGGLIAPGVGPADSFSGFVHMGAQMDGRTVPAGVPLAGTVHTYAVTWVPGVSITWYLDGRTMLTLTSAQTTIPKGPLELVFSLNIASSAAASWHAVSSGDASYAMEVLSVTDRPLA